MAEQDGEVTFDEKDVLKEQVGAKSADALEKADHMAREIATEAIVNTMSATMVAFDRFRSYAKAKVEKEGGLYEKFDHASELVADLVEVAAEEMIEDVPVVGVLLKHGALVGLHAANEHESVEAAAAEMIAEMSQQRGDAASAVPGLLAEHKYDVRNAYAKAKDPSEKESAVKTTLAGLGIAVP